MLDRLTYDVKPFSQDDFLLNSIKKDGIARIVLAPFPYPAVVVGQSSRITEEVKLTHTILDGIPIFRRKGGGCSVFLDPGSLIVSVVFPAEGYSKIQLLFRKANSWLMEGLVNSGIQSIRQDGISDIVMGDKKVGGSCFYRTRGFAYFSASVIVSCDLGLMERYLHSPPREPAYRNGRTHLDFVTTLDSNYKGLTTRNLVRKLKVNLDPMDLRQKESSYH